MDDALDAKFLEKYFDKCLTFKFARQTGRRPSQRFDSERREETGERLSASAWDIAGHPFPPMTRLPYWSHGETVSTFTLDRLPSS